jgi:hypothetical protein
MPLAISSGSAARHKGMILAKMAMISSEASPVSVKPGTTVLIRSMVGMEGFANGSLGRLGNTIGQGMTGGSGCGRHIDNGSPFATGCRTCPRLTNSRVQNHGPYKLARMSRLQCVKFNGGNNILPRFHESCIIVEMQSRLFC